MGAKTFTSICRGYARRLFSILLFSAVLVAAAFSEAAEHEAETPAESASADGAVAGTEKPSALKVKPLCRWTDHESRLASYMSRIRSLEKEISDMIEAKHQLQNAEKLRILTQQIAFKHSDLAKVVREYEEERLHVRFQHPDRELEGERRYAAQHLKSVAEIAAAFGLDGRLDRVRNQVGIVFPVSEKVKAMEVRQPASSKPEDEDAVPSGLHLVK
jgi:TolA-binding protein